MFVAYFFVSSPTFLELFPQFSHSVMSDSLQLHGLQLRQASLSIINSQSLLKLRSIESVMPSSHLILCRPLLLPPSIFPSLRVFLSDSVLCVRRPKYWCFSFSISRSSERSGRISRWSVVALQCGISFSAVRQSESAMKVFVAPWCLTCLRPPGL